MDEQARTADIGRLMAGDADAWQRLIVRYHRPLWRVVVAAVEPELRAYIDPDDILQKTYVKAFKAFPKCRFDGPGAFYRWLEAIALTKLKDEVRSLRRGKRDVRRIAHSWTEMTSTCPDLVYRLASPESTPSRVVAKDEAVAAVMSCLARLSDDQREVVRLRFLEGRSVGEIAQQLGKSEPAIHVLCHRGLKALRRCMVSITHFLTGL